MKMDENGEGRIKHSDPDKTWIIMAIMIATHIMNKCLLYSSYVHYCDLCKNLSEDDVMIPIIWRRKPRLGGVVCSKFNSDIELGLRLLSNSKPVVPTAGFNYGSQKK